MAFDRLEAIVNPRKGKLPASVALTVRGGGSARLRVSFTQELCRQAEISGTDRFDVLLGSADQRGLLRLKRSKKGIVRPKAFNKGGFGFDLGHVERFGTEAEPRQYCNAELLDADTIEVVLPPWSQKLAR